MASHSALEAGLPLEWLSRMAGREANGRRPVYQLHKYWARRPGSLLRTLLLAAFLPPEADLPQAYYEPVDLGGKVVLDPFMGGGTTVVEALRLGCRVAGIDVNPLAWWVTARQVEPIDPGALAAALADLDARVAPAIRARYATGCPQCGGPAEIVYAFWVRQAPCPSCAAVTDLFADPRLGPGGRWRCCPACGRVGRAAVPACAGCGAVAAPGVRRGVLDCGACGGRIHRRMAARDRPEPLGARLYALEYHCPACGERAYKRPDPADHERCAACAADLAARGAALPIPRHPVPDGVKTRDLLQHGFRRWDQLFSARQLLCLGELFAAIAALPPGPVRNTLLATVSDSLNANNMLCKYNRAAGKLEPLFGLHAYHIVDQPVEGNVWGAAAGRGSFRRYAEKSLRAKRWLVRPFEPAEPPAPAGRPPGPARASTRRAAVGGALPARTAAEFADLAAGDANLLLRCGSAEDLGWLPDGSVDAVVTDPPYLDNVQYGELAAFFHAWLHVALGDEQPEFADPNPRLPRELVVAGGHRDRLFFYAGLRRVFAECHRVLRDDGLLVFTFHHRDPAAWAAVLAAVTEAGFVVTAAYPVAAESRSGLHSTAGNIKYDMPFACRKRRGPPAPVQWADLRARIAAAAQAALAGLAGAARPLTPADAASVVLSKGLALWSAHHPAVFDGTQLQDPAAALAEVAGTILRILVAGTADDRTPSGKEPPD